MLYHDMDLMKQQGLKDTTVQAQVEKEAQTLGTSLADLQRVQLIQTTTPAKQKTVLFKRLLL